MNITINDFNDSTTTKAFSSFIEMFDMAPSILSKAKAIVGIQKEKFDKSERLIFERFLSHFISKNHKLLDQKTLIKMMELSSEHESVDYSITPMPIENIKKLPTDYIDFH